MKETKKDLENAGFEIWQLNEIETWVGFDKEEIIQAAMKQTGLPRDEATDESCLHKIPSSEWDKITIIDPDARYQPRYTYTNYLLMMCNDGQDFPCCFASTEF